MEILLAGSASCEACACFDEFTRTYIEVLSVIVQSITTINNVIRSNMKVFSSKEEITDSPQNVQYFSP
jgi:hypothetical protein